MQRFLLTLGFLLWFASSALALPSYCTLTGTVLSPDGTACAGCKITITTAGNQEVGGSTFPGGKARSWTTESDGDLPAGVEAARTLIVKIQIDKGATVTVQIPDTSTADISTLLLEPIDVPSSTDLNSLSGTLTVAKGGTGAAPDGDDQVLVSTGTTAADWETIPDCDGVTKALNYDVTTNTFTCNSTVSATDLACTGCVAAADLASDAVTEAKLKAVDSPADEECLTYESTGGDFEWQTCGGGGGGSGDIEVVGDCTTGECFTAASGNNSLVFEGATADAFETTLTTIDPTADATVSLPKRTGTLALEKVVNLYDYAACDGTNEATGIQAAITAACALGPGGTLYVPADTCVYGSTLTLCSGLAIVGSDSTERVAYGTAQPHELSYSGTGSAIDAQSLSGVRLAGLLLRATSGSFAGPLIDADSTGYLYLDRVNLTAATQAGAATCALLSINDGTDVSVRNSAFYRCGYAIYGRALAANYSNVVTLAHNAFYQAEVCSVQNPGDAWTVLGNKWQQQGASDDESQMFCHGAGICSEGFKFSGNMSVDQPSGPTVAEFDFCGAGFEISGNYFGGGTTQDGIQFSEPCDGCSVQGNWFGFFDAAVAFTGTGNTSESVTILGNDYDTVTTEVAGTRPGRSVMQENTGGTVVNELADIYLNADTNADSSAGAVVIGSNAASTSSTQQYVFNEAEARLLRGNDLRFYESDNSNYVQLSAGSMAADWTLTLPTTDGNANDILCNAAGDGASSWCSNAPTATALAANPSDCASDTYATTIAASGNLTCATVTNAGLAGSIAMSKTLLTADAGLLLTTNSLATASSETGFLTGSTSLPGTCGEGAVYQDTDSGGTETYTCTAANTWTKYIASTDNVATATALAANPTDCGSDTYATTIAASGNLTCASVTNASTTATAVNTASTIVLRDGSNNFAAGTITAALTGNASTATALAANPADCASDTYATTIAASGALTCATVTNAGLAGSIAVSKTLATGGAGIDINTNDFVTDSSETSFLANSGTLPGTCGEGAVYQDTDSGGTETYVCTAANTWTKTIAATDNVATATALAANPTDCGANQFANTIAASGNLTCAQPAFTDISGTAAAAQITKINSLSCTNGVQTAADGTVSCLTASSTPEYVSRVMTAGGTLGNYAVVTNDGSDDDEVIEAATTVTQILGCSQDADGTTSTNPVEVAVSGIARCKADTTVVAGSLVKLGATGEFSLATTADKTWGRAVTDDDGAGSAYVLLFDGAEGYIDHIVDLWPSVPDVTTNTLAILGITPTVNITSTGTLRGIDISPTTTMSGIGTLTAVNFGAAFTYSALVSQIYGLNMIGTYTSTDASASLAASILRNNATYTTATANAEPFSSLIAIDNKPAITNTTATTSTGTPGTLAAVNHAPVISINDPDVATGGLAAMTLTTDVGLVMGGTYTETAGTLTITNRFGLDYNEVTNTGADVTNNFGVDIAALTVGTNRGGVRNADTTVYTPCTDDIGSNTDYLARPECTAVNLTAGGARDLTAGTDQIADGMDGQIVTYFFSGSNSVKFDDADNVNLNSEAAPTGGAITLSAGDTLTLLFSSTRGEWLEVSRSNN